MYSWIGNERHTRNQLKLYQANKKKLMVNKERNEESSESKINKKSDLYITAVG
jgi:hypothetical protein